MTKATESGFLGDMKDLNIEIPDYTESELEQMDFPKLATTKENVEKHLHHLFTLLTEKYKFDMESPLVIEDFPRADIDVVSIRLLRIKIIRLKNDLKKVLLLLQVKLEDQLSRGKGSQESRPTSQNSPVLPPFAKVASVQLNSPAQKAGLETNDKIIRFGNINAVNHNNLSALAGVVKAEVPLMVEVLRGANKVTLHLVPSDKWPGRGLLGCHIVPY